MTHAVTWVANKKKIVNQADVWAVVTTNFNLLPQLSPANNIVQQEIKNAKSLSEASRILEEAVENYPCDNKSTLNFAMSTLSSCRRNCQTYRKKFMALQRQLRLVKMRSVLESTPAQRQKSVEMVTKLMVEKYFSEYICITC